MKIAKCFLIAVSVFGAAACTTVKQMPLPDGSIGHAFECSGMLDTINECYARVAKLCPEGFTIVAQSQSSVMAFDPFERTLCVRCSKSQRRA